MGKTAIGGIRLLRRSEITDRRRGFAEWLPTQTQERRRLITTGRGVKTVPRPLLCRIKSMRALKARFAFIRREEHNKNANYHIVI